MSSQPDNGQNRKVPGTAGDSGAAPQPTEQATPERDNVRGEVARLQAEVLELRQALAAAQQEAREKAALAERWEKDWHDIYALLPPELRIDPEEIANMRENGISFEEIIEEIERDMRACGDSGNA